MAKKSTVKARATKTRPRKRTPSPKSLALMVRDPNGIMAAAQAPIGGLTVTGEPTVNVATIGTLKLHEKQIKALRRPIDDHEVEWRPTRKGGPPEIPYLPHNGYRDRLDAAFGIGGWGMAPVGVPKEKDDVVYAPWALVIGGVPRFYAWGEQAYDPKNRQMTYGDALEGTKSNAIIRCGKELGIARDLWSRRYIAALKHRVPVRDRFLMDAWDAPATETGDGSRQREGSRPPAAARTGWENETISQPQYGRLRGIMKKADRTKQEVLAYLKAFYGVELARDIKRKDYDAIVQAIEGPGQLPKKEPVRVADEIITDRDMNWNLR